MSQTVHFGNSTTEFPLAAAPVVANGVTSFALTPSATVTAEAVLAAVKNADSYTITTNGTAGAEVDNVELSGNVAIDASTGNIVFALRQKSAQEVQIATLQDTVDQLVLASFVPRLRRDGDLMARKGRRKARRPTFKVYCDIAFVAEAAVAVMALAGWWRGLPDAPQIIQDDAIAFGCTIISYAIKAGFEHSKWATPQEAAMHMIADHPVATAAISGLVSSGGDLASAASSAINAAQMAAEQQKYSQSAEAPVIPPEDLPKEAL